MTSRNDRVFTRPFVLAWGTCFAFFMSFYVLLATLPIVVTDLGGTELEVGLMTALFSLSSLLVRPWVGRNVDAKGSRFMILLGTIAFAISSACFGLFRSVAVFLAVRLLHGFGMSAFGTGSSTLIAGLAPPHRRAETMGYWGLASSLPMAIGPAVGLFVMDLAGFTTLGMVSVAAALVAVALAYINVDSAKRPGGHSTPSDRWLSPSAVPPALVLTAITVPYGVISSFLPLLAIEREIPDLGLYFTVYAASLILSRTSTGRIADRFGRASVIIPGLVVCAAGVYAINVAYSLPALLVGAVLYGFGFGATQPTLAALTIDRAPEKERGIAMSTYGAAWELGMMLGASLGGPALAIGGFELTFGAAAVTPVVGLAYYLYFLRNQRKMQKSSAAA